MDSRLMTLQRKKYFILIHMIFLVSFIVNSGCTYKSADDKQIKNDLIAYILIPPSAGIKCESSPPFSSLATSGTTNNCSGCHPSGLSAFDILDYPAVSAKVTANNPEGSILYQKVSTGSMKGYSTSAIGQAIYCWIAGGANP